MPPPTRSDQDGWTSSYSSHHRRRAPRRRATQLRLTQAGASAIALHRQRPGSRWRGGADGGGGVGVDGRGGGVERSASASAGRKHDGGLVGGHVEAEALLQVQPDDVAVV